MLPWYNGRSFLQSMPLELEGSLEKPSSREILAPLQTWRGILSEQETAELLGVSRETVSGNWRGEVVACVRNERRSEQA